MAGGEADHAHAGRGIVHVHDALEALGAAEIFEGIDDLLERFVDEGKDGDAQQELVHEPDEARADDIGAQDAKPEHDEHGQQEADEAGESREAGTVRVDAEFIAHGLVVDAGQSGEQRRALVVQEVVDEPQDPIGHQQRNDQRESREELVAQPGDGTWCWGDFWHL